METVTPPAITLPPDVQSWLSGALSTIADIPTVLETLSAANSGDLAARAALARHLDERYANPPMRPPDTASIAALTDGRCTVRARYRRPGVIVLDDFLSAGECEWLIARGQGGLRRSPTIGQHYGRNATHAARTSRSYDFDRLSPDPIVEAIEQRIAALTGYAMEHGELLQVTRYGPGEYFLTHCDWFPRQTLETLAQLLRGGQRVSTVIMYLNDVQAGGHTVFSAADLRITPRKGRAVWFSNVDPSGREDPLSRHSGEPVLRGEKWIAVKWVRAQPFR